METVKEENGSLEWLAENYKNFGANLEFVTDRSSEGANFVKVLVVLVLCNIRLISNN